MRIIIGKRETTRGEDTAGNRGREDRDENISRDEEGERKGNSAENRGKGQGRI